MASFLAVCSWWHLWCPEDWHQRSVGRFSDKGLDQGLAWKESQVRTRMVTSLILQPNIPYFLFPLFYLTKPIKYNLRGRVRSGWRTDLVSAFWFLAQLAHLVHLCTNMHTSLTKVQLVTDKYPFIIICLGKEYTEAFSSQSLVEMTSVKFMIILSVWINITFVKNYLSDQ